MSYMFISLKADLYFFYLIKHSLLLIQVTYLVATVYQLEDRLGEHWSFERNFVLSKLIYFSAAQPNSQI